MRTSVLLIVFFFVLSCQTGPKVGSYPAAPEEAVVDTYHGVKVKDPYRWLEKTQSSEVKAWTRKQTTNARSYLDEVPKRHDIEKRVKEILVDRGVSYSSLRPLPYGVLALKYQPPKKQPFIVFNKTPYDTSKERVVVDPNVIDPSGATTIEQFVASPSGKYLAVSLSKAGTESGAVSIYDIKTGTATKDNVPAVDGATAGGSIVWLNDKEFLHTRYPLPGERPKSELLFYQKVYRYQLGRGKSVYEFGKQLTKISAIRLQKAPDRKTVMATVQYGDSGRFSYYLRKSRGRWKKIIGEKAEIKQVALGYNGNMFLISYKNANPGKLLKAKVRNFSLARAKTIVGPQKDTVVASFYYGPYLLATKKNIVTVYQKGGPTEVRIYDYSGRPVKAPEVPDIASINGLVSDGTGEGFYFNQNTYTKPSRYYHYLSSAKNLRATEMKVTTNVSFDGVKVVRKFAVSKDGTKVPINILLPKDYKPGESRPLILTGYGGYAVNIVPRFRPDTSVWLERGGIYAVANLRGGGEYGKKWHEEGRLTKKQNVFDDFYAASQHLIKTGFTSKEQLGIMGGSNGGLLMGAVTTQHPESFKAVVALVGIYDSLRSELSPNGAFNIPEFGTVKKKDEFQALYNYSPYHNAKKANYPMIMLATGENDNRVDPMHSLKMAARLQKLNQAQTPVLLRVDLGSGHGQGDSLDMQVLKRTDIYSFFSYALKL